MSSSQISLVRPLETHRRRPAELRVGRSLSPSLCWCRVLHPPSLSTLRLVDWLEIHFIRKGSADWFLHFSWQVIQKPLLELILVTYSTCFLWDPQNCLPEKRSTKLHSTPQPTPRNLVCADSCAARCPTNPNQFLPNELTGTIIASQACMPFFAVVFVVFCYPNRFLSPSSMQWSSVRLGHFKEKTFCSIDGEELVVDELIVITA